MNKLFSRNVVVDAFHSFSETCIDSLKNLSKRIHDLVKPSHKNENFCCTLQALMGDSARIVCHLDKMQVSLQFKSFDRAWACARTPVSIGFNLKDPTTLPSKAEETVTLPSKEERAELVAKRLAVINRLLTQSPVKGFSPTIGIEIQRKESNPRELCSKIIVSCLPHVVDTLDGPEVVLVQDDQTHTCKAPAAAG